MRNPKDQIERVRDLVMSADPPPPEDTEMMYVTDEVYPNVITAMNVIRAEQGGHARPPQRASEIPARWSEFLGDVEFALSTLSRDLPAPENEEAAEFLRAGEDVSLLESEFCSLVSGDAHLIGRMEARSPQIAMTSRFCHDFASDWSYYSDDEAFDPTKDPEGEEK